MSGELNSVVWTKRNRLRNLIVSLDRLDGQSVAWGFFEESGQHPESPHLNYPTLAYIHEFREDGIAQRPLLGISHQRNKVRMKQFSLFETKKFIERAAMLKRESPAVLLRKIGDKGVSMTKPIFGDSSLLTPNTAAVAAKKGFNAPLVDYGALKEALSSKVSWNGIVK